MAATATLVDPAWLKSRLGQPGIKVVDGSWYMPVHARDGKAEFKAARIPGALFFDVDGITDPTSSLPHMLPSAHCFGVAMDALGIRRDDTVVVMDGMGIFSAPRVWWTFKVFGHDSVVVLNGGLPAWRAAEGEVDTSPVDDAQVDAAAAAVRAALAAGPGGGPAPHYTAHLDESKVRSLGAMLANISAPPAAREQVVDARSAGRFIGVEPEPRAGLAGGHIPGARNLPFPVLLEAGKFKQPDAIAAAFDAAGVDLQQPVVASCGSGLTGAVLALGAYQVTGKLMPIYDGSWSEWGAAPGVPISTDAP